MNNITRSFLVLFTLFIVTGCGEQKYIDSCHLRVQQDVKHTAEIVTTEVEKSGLNYNRIYGKAKLQNGFGAWTNYSYQCSFTGETVTYFKLSEGW